MRHERQAVTSSSRLMPTDKQCTSFSPAAAQRKQVNAGKETEQKHEERKMELEERVGEEKSSPQGVPPAPSEPQVTVAEEVKGEQGHDVPDRGST